MDHKIDLYMDELQTALQYEEARNVVEEFVNKLQVKRTYAVNFQNNLSNILEYSKDITNVIDWTLKHIESIRKTTGSRRKTTVRTLTFFKKYGYKCYICGHKAKRIVLWEDNRDILNVALLLANGTPLTKDHVQPKSNGGVNAMRNLKPCCMECNMKKGNKVISKEK